MTARHIVLTLALWPLVSVAVLAEDQPTSPPAEAVAPATAAPAESASPESQPAAAAKTSPDAATGEATSPAAESVRRTLFAATIENETGQEQYKPVAAGIGDLVGVFLSRQENLTIVERYKLDALNREQAMVLKGLTGQEYAVAAGKLLEADTVLVGRLFLQDRKLTVSLKALEIATARVVAVDQVTCRPEDMMESALQLARNLAKQMAVPLPEINPEAVDKSPIAGLHFAQALSHYYAGDMDAAIMQLMRTIDLDPDYVEVHYWTGMCHWRLKEWPHAVIEWEKYLKRRPWSDHAKEIAPLLEQARQLDKESPVERLGPKTGAKWEAEEKIGNNPEAPQGQWLPPLRGGTQWSIDYDNGDDYELETQTKRTGAGVVQYGYYRKTMVHGRDRRRRSTIVGVEKDGDKSYSTSITCYHERPQWEGEIYLVLDSEDVQRWIAAEGAKYGVTEELSGAACPLDDLARVPDESLAKYASDICHLYDDHKRLLYVTKREPGTKDRGYKYAYYDNPDFPADAQSAATAEEKTRVNNTWRKGYRTQKTDVDGSAYRPAPRSVTITNLRGTTLFDIEMIMDYNAEPRPKITHYEITHFSIDADGERSEHSPRECRNYKVEIEDVADGDPALQGEWVRSVTPATAPASAER